MKTLWLASWYPNKLSPFNGDFIMRHARATSLYAHVHVIHLVKDEKGTVTRDIKIEETKNGQLTETIIYYHVKNRLPVLGKLSAILKYRRLLRDAIKNYLQNNKPDMVHVHVGMNAGAAALWLWQQKDIPYVITEHWTGFLDNAREGFEHLPAHIRNTWIKTARRAASISFVSHHLMDAFTKKLPCRMPVVIPNVVDHTLFYPSPKMSEATRFIHVSSLDERKNFSAILKAFRVVLQSLPAAELEVFGAVNDRYDAQVKEWGLEKNVFIHKEVPQEVLAAHTRNAVASILYSNCETFGCVIIESNASGVPVIVSDIPVFHEIVTEGINGFFVPANDPEALAKRILEMANNRKVFDAAAMSVATRNRYSYEVVGKQFLEWYRTALDNISQSSAY